MSYMEQIMPGGSGLAVSTATGGFASRVNMPVSINNHSAGLMQLSNSLYSYANTKEEHHVKKEKLWLAGESSKARLHWIKEVEKKQSAADLKGEYEGFSSSVGDEFKEFTEEWVGAAPSKRASDALRVELGQMGVSILSSTQKFEKSRLIGKRVESFGDSLSNYLKIQARGDSDPSKTREDIDFFVKENKGVIPDKTARKLYDLAMQDLDVQEIEFVTKNNGEEVAIGLLKGGKIGTNIEAGKITQILGQLERTSEMKILKGHRKAQEGYGMILSLAKGGGHIEEERKEEAILNLVEFKERDKDLWERLYRGQFENAKKQAFKRLQSEGKSLDPYVSKKGDLIVEQEKLRSLLMEMKRGGEIGKEKLDKFKQNISQIMSTSKNPATREKQRLDTVSLLEKEIADAEVIGSYRNKMIGLGIEGVEHRVREAQEIYGEASSITQGVKNQASSFIRRLRVGTPFFDPASVALEDKKVQSLFQDVDKIDAEDKEGKAKALNFAVEWSLGLQEKMGVPILERKILTKDQAASYGADINRRIVEDPLSAISVLKSVSSQFKGYEGKVVSQIIKEGGLEGDFKVAVSLPWGSDSQRTLIDLVAKDMAADDGSGKNRISKSLTSWTGREKIYIEGAIDSQFSLFFQAMLNSDEGNYKNVLEIKDAALRLVGVYSSRGMSKDAAVIRARKDFTGKYYFGESNGNVLPILRYRLTDPYLKGIEFDLQKTLQSDFIDNQKFYKEIDWEETVLYGANFKEREKIEMAEKIKERMYWGLSENEEGYQLMYKDDFGRGRAVWQVGGGYFEKTRKELLETKLTPSVPRDAVPSF